MVSSRWLVGGFVVLAGCGSASKENQAGTDGGGGAEAGLSADASTTSGDASAAADARFPAEAAACVPVTCAGVGADCGTMPDGCGGTLSCGPTCPASETCGGGGTANVCGVGTCTPTTCAAQAKDCGSISDGCGSTLGCGTCPSPESCGGGGTVNVCGESSTPPPDGGGMTDAGRVTPANTYNLGMNIPALNYYNNAAIYADMALAVSGNYGPWDKADGSAVAPLDSTGNPTVAAWTGVSANYPSGAYAVSWDGTSSVTVMNGATLGAVTVTTSNGVQHNAATMTFTQQLSTATNPVWLSFQTTGPITNFHAMAPSSAVKPGSMFVSDFLTRMQPFSTLRFMDALNTNNNNTLKNWSQRTWPTGGSRAATVQGMAYEDIIELANETGVDVWINVPALATDDYVCRLARLFRYGEQGDKSDSACDPSAPAGTVTTHPINGTSKVYVEYTNEIWNWGFQQILDVYCMVFGKPDMTTYGEVCDVTAPVSAIGAAALANTALPWDNTNTYNKADEFVMILEKRQSDTFRTVFGCSSGAHCQAQIPMNVQSSYPAEADDAFQFLKKAFGSTGALDLMAVAPYFNIEADSNADTVADVFTDLTGTVLASSPPASNGNAIVNWLTADLAEAALYGLPLVAYEGGQGISGSTNQANKIAAQSDPRMYDATRQYFALWDTLVGRKQLFGYYMFAASDGSYGAWGALVNQADPGAQKWDALLSLARLPGDANLDGVVDAADCTIVKASYGQSGMWWMQGDFDHDGTVDAADLTALNANLTGAPCTAP